MFISRSPKSRTEAFVVSRTANEFYMEVAALRLLERLRVFHEKRDMPRIAATNDRIGRQIFSRGVYEGGLLELFIEKLLRDRHPAFSSSLAIDVGANIGNHALYFSRFFGKVLGFEPNPVICDICRANVRLNKLSNVEILQFGLSDSNAVAEFHELQDDAIASSGLCRHVAADGSKQRAVEFPVELRIGDQVISEHAPEMNVALVKIDVEGHELWVVRGLERTLRSNSPVVLFESKQKHGDDGGDVTLKQLVEYGYEYFYSAEIEIPWGCRLPAPIGTICGYLQRIVTGVRHRVYLIDELEDRFYNMILASKTPIDLGGDSV